MGVLKTEQAGTGKKAPENAAQRLREKLFPRRGPDFSWLLDDWLRAVKPAVKTTTYAAYATIVEKHLRPAFGPVPVASLRESDVRGFLAACTEPPEPLAPSTVCGIASVLRSVLEHGAQYGCRVGGGACRVSKRASGSGVSVFTEEELARISGECLRAPAGKNLGVLICMHTGLRLGEICALRWGDISRESGLLSVSRTLSRIHAHDEGEKTTILWFGEPKSRNSRRKIPISPQLAALLERQRLPDDCYVLSGSAERPVEPRGMQRHFKALLRRAGVPDRNFHTLRHTFATRGVEKGVDVKSLSLLLGHSDVSITLSTYVHPSTERLREMMTLLDS